MQNRETRDNILVHGWWKNNFV